MEIGRRDEGPPAVELVDGNRSRGAEEKEARAGGGEKVKGFIPSPGTEGFRTRDARKKAHVHVEK